METFAADILAELQSDSLSLIPVIHLSLPSGGGTIYLAGKEMAIGANSYEGRIVSWQPFSRSVDWRSSNIQQASYRITCSNAKMGATWTNLSDRLKAVQEDKILAELRLYPSRLSNDATKYISIFKGYMEHIDSYDDRTIDLEIVDGLQHVNCHVGRLITEDGHGAPISEDVIGRMMPIVYGTVYDAPTICIKQAAEAILAQEIIETSATGDKIYFKDLKSTGNYIKSAGAFMIGNELIHYTTVNYTAGTDDKEGYFTGLTRGYDHTVATVHSAGSRIIQWKYADDPTDIEHDFLVAGHAVTAIENVKVGARLLSSPVDYTPYLSFSDDSGWDRKTAIVRVLTNPIYPNEEGRSVTREVQPTAKMAGTSGVTDGDLAFDDDKSTFAVISSGGKLRLQVYNDYWSKCSRSLGVFKAARIVVRSRVKIVDEDDPYVDPTDCTATLQVYNPTAGDTHTLSVPKDTGAATTANIYPSSISARVKSEEGEVDANWIGWYQPERASDTSAEWAWVKITNAEGTPGRATLTARLPTILGKYFKVSKVEAKTRYKLYQNPASPREDLDSFALYAYDEDGNALQDTSVGPANTLNTVLSSSKELTEAIVKGNVQYLTFTGYRAAAVSVRHDIDIVTLWLTVHYTPTDYGDTKEDEFDITDQVASWADIDSAIYEINFSGTGKEYRIYDVRLEIDYWPFEPSDAYALTCNVTGRTTTPAPRPYAVIKDLLEEWALHKAPSGYDSGNFFSVTVDSPLPMGDTASDYIDCRIASPVKLVDLVNEIALEGQLWVFFRNLVFYFYYRNATDDWYAAGTPWAIGDSEIIRDSLRVYRTRIQDVVNSIKAKWEYNWADSTWAQETDVSDSASIAKYGTKEYSSVLQLNYRGRRYVDAITTFMFNSLSDRRTIYKLELKPEALKLVVGDHVTLTYSPLSISAVACKVISLEFNPGNMAEGGPPYVKAELLEQQT